MQENDEIRIELERTDDSGVLERLEERLPEFLRHHRATRDGDPHVLRVRLEDPEDKAGDEPGEVAPPDRFVAEVYDDAAEHLLLMTGSVRSVEGGAWDEIEATAVVHQPVPSREEWELAVALVREQGWTQDSEHGELTEYQPMPPLLPVELEDGRTRRVLTVGLQDRDGVTRRVLGVRPYRQEVLDDLADLPRFGHGVCEPSPPSTGCEWTGAQGQAWVNVFQGGQRIWRFLLVRPAASSGTNGSGVELRFVDYRGRRVLYRAHVPILNVEYFGGGQGSGCGPTYRDWQDQETCFQAPKLFDVTPGIRLCSGPAATIIESGTDAGTFQGVAIYVNGTEVVVVSELAAGWYRYISQWRLNADGRIRPRFGFAATANPCTCLGHHHHVYWRFDLDVDGAAPNRVEEFNDPPLGGGSSWHAKSFEILRPRDAARRRRWRVRNTRTGAAYVLVPGAADGNRTAYGVGDLWALRYRSTELDDGQGFTSDPALSRARIDGFRQPAESILDRDVVLWYAAHFVHDEPHGHPGGQYVGPDLVPERWPA